MKSARASASASASSVVVSRESVENRSRARRVFIRVSRVVALARTHTNAGTMSAGVNPLSTKYSRTAPMTRGRRETTQSATRESHRHRDDARGNASARRGERSRGMRAAADANAGATTRSRARRVVGRRTRTRWDDDDGVGR